MPRIQLTRDQLAKFLPDHQAIKVFEQLMAGVGDELPADIIILFLLAEEALLAGGEAGANANEALAQLVRIANSLEMLSHAPVPPIPVAPDHIEVYGLRSVALPGDITGVLPAVNGGTGQSAYAVGDLLYASTASALSKLADIAVGNVLLSGGVGVAPAYGKVDLTAHVTGTLPVANGGTGTTTSTGTTNVVLSNSPTLVTPALGAATATSINFGQTTLNYYGEGSWTPIDSSGAALSFASATGEYTRTGRRFDASFAVTYPATADGSAATIGGLPFTTANASPARAGFITYVNTTTAAFILPAANGTTFTVNTSGGGSTTNANLSTATIFGMVTSYV